MKHIHPFTFLFIALLATCGGRLNAQEAQRYFFIGINPSVTVEPFYEKGEFDVNIFPLVYQRPLTRRLDLRLTSVANLGVRANGAAMSHFGGEAALPVFFRAKDSRKERSSGFFVAPIVSLTRNRVEQHNNLGLWLEPGYNLLFENGFALAFGLQLGGTYFAYDDRQTSWGNHFGINIIFGRWW